MATCKYLVCKQYSFTYRCYLPYAPPPNKQRANYCVSTPSPRKFTEIFGPEKAAEMLVSLLAFLIQSAGQKMPNGEIQNCASGRRHWQMAMVILHQQTGATTTYHTHCVMLRVCYLLLLKL